MSLENKLRKRKGQSDFVLLITFTVFAKGDFLIFFTKRSHQFLDLHFKQHLDHQSKFFKFYFQVYLILMIYFALKCSAFELRFSLIQKGVELVVIKKCNVLNPIGCLVFESNSFDLYCFNFCHL